MGKKTNIHKKKKMRKDTWHNYNADHSERDLPLSLCNNDRGLAFQANFFKILYNFISDNFFFQARYGKAEDNSFAFREHAKRLGTLAYHHVTNEDLDFSDNITKSFNYLVYDAPVNEGNIFQR